MDSVDRPPSSPLEETLDVFDQLDDRSAPLTAEEVAERLGYTPERAAEALGVLVERGALKARTVGDEHQVWWRPTGSHRAIEDGPGTAESATLGAFVRAVEEYAIFTLDPEGRITSWNEGARRIKGYEREEILGEHVSVFYTTEDRERSLPERNLERAAERGRIEDEGWRVRADGSEFRANVVLTAIRDDDGTLLGFTKVTRDMTDRRKQERDREQTREILRTSPVAISVQDSSGETVLANQRAQELLGLSEEEIIEEPENVDEWGIYDADGEPLDPEETPSSRVLRTGEPVYDEVVRIEPPEGEQLWLSVNAAPVFGPDGDLERVITAAEDVTGLKAQSRRAERQRDKLEHRLTEVFDRVTDAFYGLDEEWRITHANARAEEVFGRAERDVIGEVVWEAFPGMAELLDRETLREAMETGEPISEERYFESSSAWFEVRIYPSETGVSVYLTDVTERKRLEHELRAEKEQFRVALESSPLVVFRLDTELRYTWVANPHEDFDAEDVLGKRDDDLLPDDAAEVVMEPKRRALETGERVREVVTYELPSGIVSYDLTVEPLRDETGEIVGLTAASFDVTERKRAEQDLRETMEQLEVATSAGSVGLWTWDIREDVVTTDEYLAEMYGVDPEAAAAGVPMDAFYEPIHEDDEETTRERLTRAVEETGELEAEYRVRDAEGEIRWVLARGEVEYDDGEPRWIRGAVSDITERKEREFELERYRRIVETVDDGIYIADGEDRFTMVNQAYAEMTGYSREELLGSPTSIVVEPETSEAARRIQRELADGERRTARLEADVHTADGRTFRAEATLAVLPSDDSRYERIGVVRDVSERVERERELEMRVRQQQVVTELGRRALEDPDLDELFDDAVEAVADTLDNDYCKVLELLPEGDELLLRSGCGWKEGYVGEATVGTEVESQAGYTLASREPIVVDDLATEERFQGPDLLVEHDVASGISTIIGPFHDPWGILGTHDTARREFTQHDVNFVQAVANILTNAIERNQYERRLTDTIEELKESNERLEQFAYIASHDLQEPLRMVSNYLQLLEDRYRGELDDDAEEFIDFAVEGADRMREMIDDLLTYSRIERHGDPLEPVDAGAVVDRVLENLQFRIEEVDAEISVGSLPRVVGDERLLEQLFQNLVSNALKYRGDGPPRVEIDATRHGDGNWLFRVADDGIGIEPQYTDRIFEVFKRLHTHQEYPGTGIGLTLCKRIADRHDGEIWVESTPGEGSTFYVTLPAAEGEA